jgi:hypothetical protein
MPTIPRLIVTIPVIPMLHPINLLFKLLTIITLTVLIPLPRRPRQTPLVQPIALQLAFPQVSPPLFTHLPILPRVVWVSTIITTIDLVLLIVGSTEGTSLAWALLPSASACSCRGRGGGGGGTRAGGGVVVVGGGGGGGGGRGGGGGDGEKGVFFPVGGPQLVLLGDVSNVIFEFPLHLFLGDEAVLDGEEAAFHPLVQLGRGRLVVFAVGLGGGSERCSRSPRSSSGGKAALR